MGLFDWFRGSKPPQILGELCQKIAYSQVPRYAFKDIEKLKGMFQGTPSAIGPRFYAKLCEKAGLEQSAEDAATIRGSRGFWDGGREYFALEFPPPPRRRGLKKRQGEGPQQWPFLSLVVCEPAGKQVRYFVLTQTTDDSTILEEITPEERLDLGPGPEPRLSALLEFIAERKPFRTI